MKINNLREEIEKLMIEDLVRVVISNAREKTDDLKKIKIRPVQIGSDLKYQAMEYVGNAVVHKNLNAAEVIDYIDEMLQKKMKQCEILTIKERMTILISKKGTVTANRKKINAKQISKEMPVAVHNREKNYIIKEGNAVPFLVDLGVMNPEGYIVKAKYKKFKQINRFLEYIRDIKDALPKDREISIIDFGCGKSYLTFAIYYYLHEMCGLDVAITGLDLKPNVIENCNHLSEKYGYEKLKFKLGDIAEYEECTKVDMVVTLHACDTATDYALYKAVCWNASVILSVPCCQHELNRQMQNDLMQPVMNYGVLKERMAAIVTDAIRAEVLKIKGYQTDILEFIDMEHTPKNLLIRARKGKEKGDLEKLMRMVEELQVEPTILKLFKG